MFYFMCVLWVAEIKYVLYVCMYEAELFLPPGKRQQLIYS